MKWTTTPPSEPGWYWWQRVKGNETVDYTVVIEVVSIHGKLFMSETGDPPLSYYARETFKNGVHKNQWAGPLVPPLRQQVKP
jgi:hypothetical protein